MQLVFTFGLSSPQYFFVPHNMSLSNATQPFHNLHCSLKQIPVTDVRLAFGGLSQYFKKSTNRSVVQTKTTTIKHKGDSQITLQRICLFLNYKIQGHGLPSSPLEVDVLNRKAKKERKSYSVCHGHHSNQSQIFMPKAIVAPQKLCHSLTSFHFIHDIPKLRGTQTKQSPSKGAYPVEPP